MKIVTFYTSGQININGRVYSNPTPSSAMRMMRLYYAAKERAWGGPGCIACWFNWTKGEDCVPHGVELVHELNTGEQPDCSPKG